MFQCNQKVHGPRRTQHLKLTASLAHIYFVICAVTFLPVDSAAPVSETSKTVGKMQLGSTFPNFKANTTIGEIDFHEWLGDSWGILFSHPADFTPVCTTELARVAKLTPEFAKRNVKPIAISLDSAKNHVEWIKDIEAFGKLSKGPFPYPIIADENRDLAVKLNILDLDEKNAEGLPLTARAVFVIDAKKKFRLSILYPATTGRNFDEILRVIDSMQLTDECQVATPADWKQGDSVMVQPSVSAEQVAAKFPKAVTVELPSGKSYLRQTPQP